MKDIANLPKNGGLMLLSICLAVLLWLLVNYTKEAERELVVPVTINNLDPSLAIEGTPPKVLNVRIVGPHLEMVRILHHPLTVTLDLRNVEEGSAAFTGLDRLVPLPQKIRVTRVYPGTIEVKLVKKER